MLATQLGERLRDIPLQDVMEKLGYGREQIGNSFVYRDAQKQVALVVRNQQMHDSQQRLICKNSIDLVVYMQREQMGRQEFTTRDAAAWLADNFGDRRAAAAGLYKSEQDLFEYFAGRRQEKEREEQQRGLRPERGQSQVTQLYDRGVEQQDERQRDEPERDYGFSR